LGHDKRSLAYAVSAVLSEGLFDRGYFAVYLACEPRKLNEAVEETIKVLKKACEDGVTEEEVVRAKNYIIGNHKIALQGSYTLASTLALNEAYGLGYGFYLAYPQKIERVTREDVLRVARAYLTLDRPTLAVVGSLSAKRLQNDQRYHHNGSTGGWTCPFG
jgi:zinc protease